MGSLCQLDTHLQVKSVFEATIIEPINLNLHWKHSLWGSPAQPLGHLHTGLWPVVWHKAFLPHGASIGHGSRHWLFMHALLSGHSESSWHSPCLTANRKNFEILNNNYDLTVLLLATQMLYGSPVRPGGHLQTALWLLAEHSAVELQGLSCAQGLTQALFLQAWVKGHSLSPEHPTSTGAATKWKSVSSLQTTKKV